MKIFPAELAEAGDSVTVTYRFETSVPCGRNGALWFRIGAKDRDRLATGPEPAAAALMMLAMALGEDLVVTEPVSARFHYGWRQCVAHFHMWLPRQLKTVALRAPALVRSPPPRDEAVMSCFSGGVDSFHTLYDHLAAAESNKDFRLTHLFFVDGFDIPLGASLYAELAAEFAGLAERLGLRLVRLATNVRQVLDAHVPWVTAHGVCLAAGGLLLAGGTRRFIIPSTNRQSLLFSPCGSNPVTDPMLGTETLDIVHYGTHLSRIQKILTLADRREAQAHLRVCWQNVPGMRNCGRCLKCLKTMMPLALAGALEQFAVFPALPPWGRIDPQCFAPLDLSRYAPEQTYADELRALAAQYGHRDPVPARTSPTAWWRRMRNK